MSDDDKRVIRLRLTKEMEKVYVSSYFATLNARAELREKISDSLSIHLSELSQYPRNESERSISVAGDGKVGICFASVSPFA